MEVSLDTLGRSLFTTTICGDEVTDPKPAPDAYLRAAAVIGVDPRRCIAIEDSPMGVAAAEAAGCAVLAVPSEVPIAAVPGREVRPTLVGVELSDLHAMVEAHANSQDS